MLIPVKVRLPAVDGGELGVLVVQAEGAGAAVLVGVLGVLAPGIHWE